MLVSGLFPHLFSSLCPSLSCFVRSERLGFLSWCHEFACRSSACFGTASPEKSSLDKEVCGGLACSEGMNPQSSPPWCLLTVIYQLWLQCLCSMQEGHPGEELLLASAGLEGARPDPGAAVAWSTVTAPRQGTLVLQAGPCTEHKPPFWGRSTSRLSFLSPRS